MSPEGPEGGPGAGEDAASTAWADAESRVEEFLLGGPRRVTRGEVADRTGVPLEHSARLWNALGFASTRDDVPSFTESDLDALRLTDQLISDDTFDEGEALAVARTLGQSLARLAEWQATLLRRVIIDHGRSNDPDAVVDAVERLVPVLEQLQSYVWRRHLGVTAGRLMAGLARPDGTDAETVTVVGFADLVGFTSLSRQVDADELRSLLERFAAVSTDVVVGHGGRIVKTLGDEVLFVRDGAGDGVAEALALAFALHAEVPDHDGRLALRIGLARGEVLARYGDVYGPTVNIAARLTSHARPGSVLLDDGMSDAVRARGLDVELRSVPPLKVRGYKHLTPHVVRARGGPRR